MVTNADLAHLLLLIALIAGTIDYAEMMRRRVKRAVQRTSDEAADSGLRGLVRVFVADG